MVLRGATSHGCGCCVVDVMRSQRQIKAAATMAGCATQRKAKRENPNKKADLRAF
jgi:hypothetical protein